MKAKRKAPQPRHVWGINPKTRVKTSKKRYSRKNSKPGDHSWHNDL